jgi:hypothetical protein
MSIAEFCDQIQNHVGASGAVFRTNPACAERHERCVVDYLPPRDLRERRLFLPARDRHG